MENIYTSRVIFKVLLGGDRVFVISYKIQCLRVLLGDQDDPWYKRDPQGRILVPTYPNTLIIRYTSITRRQLYTPQTCY
uniref:OJ1005_B10.6 protein n=1 Tax=Oryza sativa subsp. japonica TaxID=39947 RepID=Q7EZP6_ORYSJ|nr:OJ1005_B10.6 [Oryza sativa Japonica Group]